MFSQSRYVFSTCKIYISASENHWLVVEFLTTILETPYVHSLIDESWNDKEFTITGFGEIDAEKNALSYLGFAQKCKKVESFLSFTK